MKPTTTKLLFLAAVLAAISGCSNGCTGPKGDLGPSGPQGPAGSDAPNTAPIYYYNSNFDTQGDLSEWTTYVSGGGGAIHSYLDSTKFNSPAVSMGVSITGIVAGDSFVHQTLPFDTTKDIWVELDWYLRTGGESEVVLNLGSLNKAIVGFDGSNIFLVHGTTRYNVVLSPSTSVWHHVKIRLTPSSGRSSYWFNGASIGTNYETNLTPAGVPPTGSFLGFKIFFFSGIIANFDNVQCYRY